MWLTPKELAERLKVTDGTLRKWRIAKVGPKYVKLGDSRTALVRYKLEDVEAFEQSNKGVA
jgi:hypothetical protein